MRLRGCSGRAIEHEVCPPKDLAETAGIVASLYTIYTTAIFCDQTSHGAKIFLRDLGLIDSLQRIAAIDITTNAIDVSDVSKK